MPVSILLPASLALALLDGAPQESRAVPAMSTAGHGPDPAAARRPTRLEDFQYQTVPDDLWAQIARPQQVPFPPLSKLARLHGTIPVLVSLNDAGQVVSAKPIGDVSKAREGSFFAVCEAWARTLVFPKGLPHDRPYLVKVRFYPAGTTEATNRKP